MLVLVNDKLYCGEEHTPQDVKEFLRYNRHDITELNASGYEIVKCFDILGRKQPEFITLDGERSYSFFGDNAKEIAANWY
jgi:hypothetical protein